MEFAIRESIDSHIDASVSPTEAKPSAMDMDELPPKIPEEKGHKAQQLGTPPADETQANIGGGEEVKKVDGEDKTTASEGATPAGDLAGAAKEGGEKKEGLESGGKAGSEESIESTKKQGGVTFDEISEDEEEEEEDDMLLDLEESASAAPKEDLVEWRLIEQRDDDDEEEDDQIGAQQLQYNHSAAAAHGFLQPAGAGGKRNHKRKRQNGNSHGDDLSGKSGGASKSSKHGRGGKERKSYAEYADDADKDGGKAYEEEKVKEPKEEEDRYDSDGGIVVTRPRKRRPPTRLEVDGTPDRPRRHEQRREPQRQSRRERMSSRKRGVYGEGSSGDEDDASDLDDGIHEYTRPPTASNGKKKTGGTARTSAPAVVAMVPATRVEERAWAQCGKCEKWRQLAVGAATWQGEFFCSMNAWDQQYDSCDKQEDPTANDTDGNDSTEDAGYVQAVAMSLQHAQGSGAVPPPAIGETIEVLWPEDQQYYLATVEAYNSKTREHTIEYATGDVEDLDLSKGGKPPPPQHALLQGLSMLQRSHSLTQWRSVRPAPKKKSTGKSGKKGLNRKHTRAPSEKGEKFEVPLPSVGQRLEIVWPANKLWYSGVVDRFDRPSGLHVILYDEGTEEMVDFGYADPSQRRKGKKHENDGTKAVWEGVWDGQEGDEGGEDVDGTVARAVARAKATADRANDGGDRGSIAACAGTTLLELVVSPSACDRTAAHRTVYS
jgi:hypothetical protein